MADAAIGALAVRIVGDASKLISELDKAEKALKGKQVAFKDAAKAAAAFSAAAAAAGGVVFAMVKHVANMADELGKMSQKVGVSVESLSALKHAGALADVSFQTLSQGLRFLNKNMADMQAGTGEAKEAFKAMGIEVESAPGKLKMTEEMLMEVADQFAGMKDGAGKTALAMRIFGKSGADLIPLLNEGRAGIKAMKEEAERLGLVISTQAAKEAELFNDNITRLTGSVTGLAIELAGPLIKSLGDATTKMVEARKEGEGFFSAMAKGLGAMVFGSDEDATNRSIVRATDRLKFAQDDLDRARQAAKQGAVFGADARIKAPMDELERAVKDAQVEVNRLLGIKELMTGSKDQFLEEAGRKAKEAAAKNKKDAPAMEASGTKKPEVEWQPNLDFIDKDSEFWAKLNANRVESEKQAQADRNQILMDAFDAEQAAAIERGALLMEVDGIAHSEKMRLLRESMMSAEELEQEAHDKKMEKLQEFSDAELEALGGRQAVIEQMEQEHQNRLVDIRSRGLATLAAFNKANWQQQTKHVVGELVNMTAGVAQHSKKLFQINKMAGIANAIISTAAGVAKAIETYPPPLSIAMAAVQFAAGMAQVSAIRSTQFGGGGAGKAPSVGGTPAPAVTPVGGGASSSGGGGPATIVNLPGEDFVSTETVRKLLESMNEGSRDGGRVIITRNR